MRAELNRLEELLKKKGIGPEGSKSLKAEELHELTSLFSDPAYSLTTKATLLTALLMLPASEAEKAWLNIFRIKYSEFIPADIHFIITQTGITHPFQDYLCKTISGINLSYDEASNAMDDILNNESIPEYWKGAFWEAQRLKRESFDENKAFFDVLWDNTNRIQTTIPILIDISDNYDGFNRYNNLGVFFAATIASCGYRCIIHGTDSIAPKFGITSRQVLDELKANITTSEKTILDKLQHTSVGWAYIDQSFFHPTLNQLKKIRKEMVKRPFLATFEKVMQPVRAQNGNHIVTGYTHAHYRTEVAEQIKEQGKSYAAMVIKGLEGSSCPPLNRETVQVILNEGKITDQMIKPVDFFSTAIEQLPAKEINVSQVVSMGMRALQGEKNEAYYQILYYASMVLCGFGLENKQTVTEKVKRHLTSGDVYQTLINGIA